jgi:hypothetical protein
MAELPPNPLAARCTLSSIMPPVSWGMLLCLFPDGLLDLQKHHKYLESLWARVRWQMSTAMN